MKKTFIAVRNVDEETFRKFKETSIRNRIKLGVAITLAMKDWIKERLEKDRKKGKGIFSIKPEKIGNKKVNWSKEIDEILYTGK